MKKYNAGIGTVMNNYDVQVKESKLVVLVLAVLICCSSFSGCAGREVSALTGETVVISSFSEERVCTITVELGTDAEAIGLPAVLAANIVVVAEPGGEATEAPSGETGEDATATAEPDASMTQAVEMNELRDVPVFWECADYDSGTAGAYVFTAQLESGYAYEGEMPTVTVEVQAASEPEPSVEPAIPEESEISTEPITSEEPEVSAEPTQTPKPTVTTEPGEYIITGFTNESIEIEVGRGTATADIPLPQMLSAVNESGDTVEVAVTWTNETVDTDEYETDPNNYETGSQYSYGPWTFTASVNAAYTYVGEPVTASVSIPECMNIQSFCGIKTGGLLMRFVAFEGDIVNLPTQVSAFMTDGGYKNIPVSWSGSYDLAIADTYRLTMSAEGGYTGGEATAEIVVIRDADE